MKKLLSWFFIIQSLSLFTIFIYQLYLQESPSNLSFNQFNYTNHVVSNGLMPSRILIPALGIDVPIYKATIVHHIWPTTDLGASYLTTSPLPGSKGNSIIYAHDFRSLFGNLVYAKVGQSVVVTYPNKTKKIFVIAYTSQVSPNESTILAPSNDKRVTLYTCTGFFDSKRFVAVAILKS